MTPLAERMLGWVLTLCCAAILVLSLHSAKAQRRTRTCQGKGTLEVTVVDSAGTLRLCTRGEIEDWLDKQYGVYAGLPLDKVDLCRMERILREQSVIRDCEAWMGDDGILHLAVTERTPLLRLQCGHRWLYADALGHLFPLRIGPGSPRVPVVDGHIPLSPQNFQGGVPKSQREKAWLAQMVKLTSQLEQSAWAADICQIHASEDGTLQLVSRSGDERFLFGPPVRIDEKLELLDIYLRRIAPARGRPKYKVVDLRHRGQLVCKKNTGKDN